MKSVKKQTRKQLTEKEIDAIVESQADDASAWEKPLKVRRAKPASLSIPAELAARAAFLADAPVDRLDDAAELALMRKIALYPRMVEAAAAAHEPHRVAVYLFELASEFHAQWTRGNDLPHLRFIIQNDPQLTTARLVLIQGVVTVLASGLKLLGVGAPDEMR